MSRLFAVVVVPLMVSLPNTALAKGADPALGRQMQRVANRFVSAIRRTKPLKGFMSKRVTVTFHTDDRSEGTFDGKTVVDAAAIDGTVDVPGKTGGYAWAIEKKIKPAPKTLKLHVGKMAYEILRTVREQRLERRNRISVDKKKLTFYIEGITKTMTFHFRLEGKRLLVHKLGFSESDPG